MMQIILKKEKTHEMIVSKILVKLLKMIYRPQTVEPDILLEDGDEICGHTVIHTLGHTTGSICLYNKNNKALFVGGNLKNEGRKIEGPPRIFTLNIEQTNESIKKLEDLDIELIYRTQ